MRNGSKGICDHCQCAVYVRGVHEREWVHYHGSVFCMTTYASVDGVHYLDPVTTVKDTVT